MKKTLLILLFLFSFSIVYSQSAKTRPQTDNKTEKEAERLWKTGDYAAAEKLYRQAYTNTGNVHHLTPLAKKKFEIGDVKGANALYDIIIKDRAEYVKGLSLVYRMELNMLYFEKIDKNFKTGSPEVGIATTLDFVESIGKKVEGEVRGFYYLTYTSACEAAFALDDEAALIKLHEKAGQVEKGGEYQEFLSDVYLHLVQKDYNTALKKVEDVIGNGGEFMSSKTIAKALLPTVYTSMGENEKALAAIDESKSSSLFVGDGYFQYLYGVIALNKKNYKEAIERFNQSIQGPIVFFHRVEPVGKYKHYSKRAEAYMALGNLVQARKDFESALVYNASYEPALNGIAKLEGRMINERKTDKTPPVIAITEPALSRGLKITSSGKDIMVKGKATDAAGLSSVTLNGQLVYSKNEGDFWGSVSLVSGSNKIKVVATDMAGNAAEELFEIEKNEVVAADIVPVQQKEGKNYAVLIASQNYDDMSIPSLENPIPDAVRLKMILKNSYNFGEENVLTLFNPERADFRKKFLQLTEILQPEDNLIIFYAGHGIWVDKEKKGYWLLTDAKRNDVNTWLPNKEVLGMIAEVPSRHTLLITDACFSGSVFKTRSIGSDASPAVREMSEKISRVAITSGNDTEVPDESVFMKYLVKALSENKDKYLTAQKMFITQIIEAVMAESKTEPRYGTLELAGHVGGDFIFTKK
jgi:tetratricopeptide (TPR) repeat protein